MDEFAGSPAAETNFAVAAAVTPPVGPSPSAVIWICVTVPRLRVALAEAFAGPSCDVVVDLGDVDFFEVTALNLFAETARRLDRTGGRLFLRELSSFQHRILIAYGLTRLASGAWAERVSL